MKRALPIFSSDELAALRMLLASAALAPIALKNLAVLRQHWKPILITGLSGNAIPYFLFALAQTHISSSLSGILNSLTSLFTLLLGVAFYGQRTSKSQVAGVAFALLGAAGLIGFAALATFADQAAYALLVVLATLLYGVAVNTVKWQLAEVKPMHITSLAFLITGPACGIYLFTATDFLHKAATHPDFWSGSGYVAILGVAGTAIAVGLFNLLIKQTTAVFASSVTYLIPVVALGWGWMDGEPFQLTDLLYIAFILLGILLINTKMASSLKQLSGGLWK